MPIKILPLIISTTTALFVFCRSSIYTTFEAESISKNFLVVLKSID